MDDLFQQVIDAADEFIASVNEYPTRMREAQAIEDAQKHNMYSRQWPKAVEKAEALRRAANARRTAAARALRELAREAGGDIAEYARLEATAADKELNAIDKEYRFPGEAQAIQARQAATTARQAATGERMRLIEEEDRRQDEEIAAEEAANTSEADIGNVANAPSQEEGAENPPGAEEEPSTKVPKGGKKRKTRRGKKRSIRKTKKKATRKHITRKA